jgi:hypothetical protein
MLIYDYATGKEYILPEYDPSAKSSDEEKADAFNKRIISAAFVQGAKSAAIYRREINLMAGKLTAFIVIVAALVCWFLR